MGGSVAVLIVDFSHPPPTLPSREGSLEIGAEAISEGWLHPDELDEIGLENPALGSPGAMPPSDQYAHERKSPNTILVEVEFLHFHRGDTECTKIDFTGFSLCHPCLCGETERKILS
jgi:hypothetical protein